MPRVIDLSTGAEVGLSALGAGLAGSANTGRRVRNEEREQGRADQRLDLQERAFERRNMESDRLFDRGVFESDRGFTFREQEAARQQANFNAQMELRGEEMTLRKLNQEFQHEIERLNTDLRKAGFDVTIEQLRADQNFLQGKADTVGLDLPEGMTPALMLQAIQENVVTNHAIEKLGKMKQAGAIGDAVADGMLSKIESGGAMDAILEMDGIAKDFAEQRAEQVEFQANGVKLNNMLTSEMQQGNLKAKDVARISAYYEMGVGTYKDLAKEALDLAYPEDTPQRNAAEGESRARGGAPKNSTRHRMANGEEFDVPDRVTAPEEGAPLVEGSNAYEFFLDAAKTNMDPEGYKNKTEYEAAAKRRAVVLAQSYGGWGPIGTGEKGGESTSKSGASAPTRSQDSDSHLGRAFAGAGAGYAPPVNAKRSSPEASTLPQAKISDFQEADYTTVIDQIREKYPRATVQFIAELMEKNPDMTAEEFMSAHQKQFKNR